MILTVDPELEAALSEQSKRQGKSPDRLALEVLRSTFLTPSMATIAHEEWVARLRMAGSDCGVSLSNAAVSSEGFYE